MGFYGPFAEQNLIFVYREGAGDNTWVLVVNGIALIAGIALAVIACRNAQNDFGAAVAAVVHNRYYLVNICHHYKRLLLTR